MTDLEKVPARPLQFARHSPYACARRRSRTAARRADLNAEERGGPEGAPTEPPTEIASRFAGWRASVGRDAADEDALQEYAFDLLSERAQQPPPAAPRARRSFFARLLRRMRIDGLRRAAAEFRAAAGALLRRPRKAPPDPADRLLEVEVSRALARAVVLLPRDARRAFLALETLDDDARAAAKELFGTDGPREVAAVHRAASAARTTIERQVAVWLNLEPHEPLRCDAATLHRLLHAVARADGLLPEEAGESSA